MSSIPRTVILLVLFCSLVFTINFKFTGAYLGKDEALARELRSPGDSIYLWRMSHEVPFKYRLLFSEIVKATWKITRNGPHDNGMFMKVFRVWSFVFFVLATLTFYGLLLTLGFDPRWAFVGALLYLSIPPISFAYTYPVHAKEDLLGFTLLHTGLIAFFKRNTPVFCVVSCLGILCRESLLILSFIFFFYSDVKLIWRMLFAAVSFGVFVAVRMTLGFETYDVLGLGFKRNLDFFFQSIAFLSISFNVLWLLSFYSWIRPAQVKHENLRLFLRTAPPAFALIFITSFLGGRIMELRLINLAAPWIIVSALALIQGNFESLRRYVETRLFLGINILSLIFISLIYFLVYVIRPETFKIMTITWWVILFLSCHLTFVSIPVFRKLAVNNNS